MSLWEYIHAKAEGEKIIFVNGKVVGESRLAGLSIKHPNIDQFLTEMGQQGWEAVGMCPADQVARTWRLILKRPLST